MEAPAEPREPAEPWDRRPEETEKAWLAFKLYRDMGPGRSLARAYHAYRIEAGNVSGDDPALEAAAGYFNEWSTGNAWVKRVQAYDAWQTAEAERKHRAVLEAGRELIANRYVHLIALQLANVEMRLVDGKLTQNTNMALKDLFDRLGGAPTQRVQLDHELNASVDATPAEVKHTFMDGDKALEIADILRQVGAFTAGGDDDGAE